MSCGAHLSETIGGGTPLKNAGQPFRFVTVSYLTRIGNQSAMTLRELRDSLGKCSDASIFYHTFQSLGHYHFLTEGFSNDFAQWVLAALNYPILAEQLAAPDIRSYLTLAEIRSDLLRITDEYCLSHPGETGRLAFEPFHFCESVEVTIPRKWEAWTLEEFRQGLEHLSNESFHYHFLVSRLRHGLRTNDFSLWFQNELGLQSLAQRTNRIDVYTNTVEGARARLQTFVDRELAA
jgi:hypothetical protein